MYRRFEFAKASNYIESQLNGDPVSQALKNLDLDRGCVFAFLPREVNIAEAQSLDFKMSLQAQSQLQSNSQVDWSEIDNENVQFVANFLKKDRNALAFFASPWYANDPVTDRLSTPFFLMGDVNAQLGRRICSFLSEERSSEIEVRTAFREAQPYPFLAGLTFLPSGSTVVKQQVLSDREISGLIDRMEYLLMGAFDNEVKLFWQRSDSFFRN